MLKLWDLDDNFGKMIKWKYDRTQKGFLMEHLLLRGIKRDFPTNCELFWDVKMKYGVFVRT